MSKGAPASDDNSDVLNNTEKMPPENDVAEDIKNLGPLPFPSSEDEDRDENTR